MLPSSSPFASRGLPPAAMYRRVGLETKVHGASPHMLVALLFDGLLEQLSVAAAAVRDRRIADKGHAIGRAVRILDEGLKAALDLDAGGKLAADLETLYAYATLRITQANLNNDSGALDECRRLIVPVRDAWAAIGTDAVALRRA